jgi:hypothetical protein
VLAFTDPSFPGSSVATVRRSWLIGLVFVTFAGLLIAGFEWNPFADETDPTHGLALRPAPTSCITGTRIMRRFPVVSVEAFIRLSDGRGPTWLPSGFGLARTVGELGPFDGGAVWTDAECHLVAFGIEGNDAGRLRGEQVGEWTLTDEAGPADCPGGCLWYSVKTTDRKTLSVYTQGVDRSDGDRIVRSFELSPVDV